MERSIVRVGERRRQLLAMLLRIPSESRDDSRPTRICVLCRSADDCCSDDDDIEPNDNSGPDDNDSLSDDDDLRSDRPNSLVDLHCSRRVPEPDSYVLDARYLWLLPRSESLLYAPAALRLRSYRRHCLL